jgi:hypothetical protein
LPGPAGFHFDSIDSGKDIGWQSIQSCKFSHRK